MEVAFVRDFADIDGTLTLVYRLARQLKLDGHRAHYIHFGKLTRETEEQLSDWAQIHHADDLTRRGAQRPRLDVMHVFADGDRLIDCLNRLSGKLFRDAAFVMGVYHPRAFVKLSRIGLTPDARLYRRLFRALPRRNVMFMNEAVRSAHQLGLGIDLSESPIIPLPVDVPSEPPFRPRPAQSRLVSIGRLTPFKSYVLTVLPVLADLRRTGVEFQYDVYGDGPLRTEVERSIRQLGLEGCVHLGGTLPYSETSAVLKDASAFLGMGTALVEAAAQGVPALLAIESNERPTTYGWFGDAKGYTVGERLPGHAEVPLADSLRAVFGCPAEEFDRLVRASHAKALAFSLPAVARQHYRFYSEAGKGLDFTVSKPEKVTLKIMRQLYKPLTLPIYRQN